MEFFTPSSAISVSFSAERSGVGFAGLLVVGTVTAVVVVTDADVVVLTSEAKGVLSLLLLLLSANNVPPIPPTRTIHAATEANACHFGRFL